MLTTIRYLALALCVVGILWAFHQFNQSSFRYAYDPCQRKLIFERNEDIDFLVVGGSRMMMAIRSDKLSQALSKPNEDVVVYDLSRSWRSEFHNYIFLRDLYDQGRNVKNMIILFYGANDLRYHPHTHIIGKPSDILELTVMDKSIPWTEKLQGNLSLNIKRATYHLENWFQGTLHNEPSEVRSMTNDVRDCSLKETSAKPVTIVEKNDSRESVAPAKMEWNFKNAQNERVQLYLKKTIELASSHGTNIYLALPIPFLRKPLSAEFVQDVEKTFGVPFLTPDSTVVKKFNEAKYYADESHMTPEGAALFSEWLGKEIARHENRTK